MSKKLNHKTSSLIEFSVENFGCFRDKVTFSMESRADARNTFYIEKIDEHVLTTSFIYGPNASGKSTLIKAIQFLAQKILSSTEREGTKPFSPFVLQEGFKEKPSSFEIMFIIEGETFRYECKITPDHIVIFEELTKILKTTEQIIFKRENNIFSECKKEFDDKSLKEKTKEHYLFLSTCSQWNVKLAEKIYNFFEEKIHFLKHKQLDDIVGYTQKRAKSKEFKEKVLNELKNFDISFLDFNEQEREVEIKDLPLDLQKIFMKEKGLPPNAKIRKTSLEFLHKYYDKDNREIVGGISIPSQDHSEGTLKLFNLLGPILDVLENGYVLIFDELNANFHPLIVKGVVDLFHSKETNPNNAQLIFTTHDPSLLTYTKDEIDRDQVWFTDRDQYGRASLFSLSEFKERKDTANVDHKYLKGAYGGIPFIDNFKI